MLIRYDIRADPGGWTIYDRTSDQIAEVETFEQVGLAHDEAEEIAALARAAASGLHRDPSRPAISDDEQRERRLADEQDAALYLVAAATGLRLGELLALRWRYVSFERETITVAFALSGGRIESPKWGKTRTVPLIPQAAAAFEQLSKRGRFVAPEDLVFCGPLGQALDDSAIRRRLRSTQEAAGLRRRRFHDLRHTFGSIGVREFDTTMLKAWMGHSKLATTERYLHAKPRHSDVERLARLFQGKAGEVGEEEPSGPREDGATATGV